MGINYWHNPHKNEELKSNTGLSQEEKKEFEELKKTAEATAKEIGRAHV